MKLYPLEPTSKLSSEIEKTSRRLKLDVIIKKPFDIGALVVIGDGALDGKALAILAYHLNGDRGVALAKPKETRLGAVDKLPSYLGLKFRKIAILIDQEEEGVDNITSQVEDRLRRMGVDLNVEDADRRFKLYRCVRGGKDFKLALAINGLDNIAAKKHSIEDHFVMAAKACMPDIKISELEGAKESWEKLNEKDQLKVFEDLRHNGDVKRIFPQQVKALRALF
jgi:hypothetical protein